MGAIAVVNADAWALLASRRDVRVRMSQGENMEEIVTVRVRS